MMQEALLNDWVFKPLEIKTKGTNIRHPLHHDYFTYIALISVAYL